MGSWALILILLNNAGTDEIDRKVNTALSSFKNEQQCIDYVSENHEKLKREGIYVRGSLNFKFKCVAIESELGLSDIFDEKNL